MRKIIQSSIVIMSLIMGMMMVACGPTRPDAEKWTLPKKEGAQSGMIIGRIDFPDNKTENPNGDRVYLSKIEFWKKGRKAYFNSNGEQGIALDNNYFVVPNLEPGKYYLSAFRTGELYNNLPRFDDKYLIEVKPGQIAFFGSIDYVIVSDAGVFKSGTYSLRKAAKPSEREMLQWLYKSSIGSGWEQSIKKRLKELGG